MTCTSDQGDTDEVQVQGCADDATCEERNGVRGCYCNEGFLGDGFQQCTYDGCTFMDDNTEIRITVSTAAVNSALFTTTYILYSQHVNVKYDTPVSELLSGEISARFL